MVCIGVYSREQIIKHFDIDTRIRTDAQKSHKCDVFFNERHQLPIFMFFMTVHKLKVPQKLINRLVKVMTYRVHVMLSRPYYNYVSDIGPHNPDVWIDKWYEKEWPLRITQYLSWFKQYGIVEHF
jgi:hypothetical protein